MAEMGSPTNSVEILLELERFFAEQEKNDTLVLDLANAFERVSFPVVWAWATYFSFPRKILRVLCGCCECQRRVQFVG